MTLKTFNVPSFFAGVATVLAILVVGFGGGVMMGGVMMGGVISGGSKTPTKIERQTARDTKEIKSADVPVIPAATVVVAPAPTAPAQAAAAALDPVPAATPPTPQAEPQPQPAPQQQAQPAPQPQTQPQQALHPQTMAQTPALGPQKPVLLAEPPREEQRDPSQLSRREQARYWRHQRRDERVLRREEWRKETAQRRQQQTGREETRSAIQRARPQDADDERDDDGPAVAAPRGRVDAPPPSPFLKLFGGD